LIERSVLTKRKNIADPPIAKHDLAAARGRARYANDRETAVLVPHKMLAH
jgi:hypothetical protein